MPELANLTSLRVHWIGGWGTSPEALRSIATRTASGAAHTCVAPTRRALAELPPVDILVGWSLGAWRVLEAAAGGVPLPNRVILLAPFVAFGSEYQLGGRCSVTQVRFLHRWMQREPLAALKDFHARAGLGPAPDTLPYAIEDLLEGLQRLAEDATPTMRQFAAAGLPAGWTAVVGGRDPLLDPEAVARTIPGTTIVQDAGHDPASLVTAIQNAFHAV